MLDDSHDMGIRVHRLVLIPNRDQHIAAVDERSSFSASLKTR